MEKTPPILAFIPARHGSTRFPGKPLATIGGKSMIARIYRNCARVPEMETFVVTDDDRIESHVREFGGNVLRVDEPLPNGTERIHRAWIDHLRGQPAPLILNVQGDLPLLDAHWIQKLTEFHRNDASTFPIATLVAPRPLPIDDSPHKVKVVYSRLQRSCLYFSRHPLPYNPSGEWFGHIGIYSFQPEALKCFAQCQPSPYEQCEGLEQLRALELGLTIAALEIDGDTPTVDIPEDIDRIERLLNHEQQ